MDLLRRPPETDVSKSVIDRVATQLKALGTGNSPAEVLQIGELIFREIYGCERMFLKKGTHHPSLRRLGLHPDVPFKVTTLWRAVSMYEMSLRFPQLFETPQLGVSHLRAVIGLPFDIQESLLRAAAQERWTKRRLEEEASRHRQGDRKRGRKPLPKLLKLTRELERLLDRFGELDGTDFQIRGSVAKETRGILERFRQHCDEVEGLMPPPSSRPNSAL